MKDKELTDKQFDTLAAITAANIGAGKLGIKVDDAHATFNKGTLNQLAKRGLIHNVEQFVGRYATLRTYMRPTTAGFAALS